MKKLALLASVLFVVGMTSCKKDYDCTCTYSVLGVTTTATTTINDTKSNAEDTCSELETTSDISCEIE